MNPYSASTPLVSSPGFSQRLVERMEQTGWGTVALAEAAAVNKETISLWRGGRQPSYTYERVVRVAAVLGTTAEELLDPPEPPASRPVAAAHLPGPPSRPQEDLLRRIAKLGPLLESLSQLEEVIAEARELTEE